MTSLPRRKSGSEFEAIRLKLTSLKVPIRFVDHHINALQKAYQVRAKNRAARERRMEQRLRTPVTRNSPDGCTMGPKRRRRRVGRPRKEEWLNGHAC